MAFQTEILAIAARPLDRLADAVPADVLADASAVLEELRGTVGGRVVWNVNSTARGGGVAELLQSLVAYTRGAGIDVRWAVIAGDARFFHITKRIHHALHGAAGDGSPLGEAEDAHYQAVLEANCIELGANVAAGDVVLLHDPQTAGLIGPLVDRGCTVIWRCHVGHDAWNDEAERGWGFLAPHLAAAHGYVFSRAAYVPPFLADNRCVLIAPCIDPASPKNQPMSGQAARSILAHVGLIAGPSGDTPRRFLREDGSQGRVDRLADILRLGRVTPVDRPMVVQVSRWDVLKDPIGVIRGFAAAFDGHEPSADLLLAGPNVKAVSDDPEGAEVFGDVVTQWRALPHSLREHVHLVNLPMADIEENAAIVNALQRHAAIVVQKSLHEGFGLTVTEAMWKARPVLASRVGGIVDQIEHERTGLLLDDPTDAAEFGAALRRLLADAELRARLGAAAQNEVIERFLLNRHLRQYTELLVELDGATG